VTQEFQISVTPVGEDRYLVRTENPLRGVPIVQEQVIWPVEEWLAQTRLLMGDPLLGVLQGLGSDRVGHFKFPAHPNRLPGNNSAQSSISLVELGQQLYAGLFQRSLRDSWVTAQGIAQHRGEILRLRLGLKGWRLPRLPWEVMQETELFPESLSHADGLGPALRPIATRPDIIFSRYQLNTSMVSAGLPIAAANQPLRILMVIAAPTDQERLNLRQEVLHLQQELCSPLSIATESTPNIQVTVLEQPGREQLTQALDHGQYHILHYAGHSNQGVYGGNLCLVNNRTGLTEILSGDDLAGLLVNNSICMVVFNSCQGAHTAAAGLEERNLAEALVSRGIPAVLAMAERIPDDVALNLTRLFYRKLKQGYPVDLSLNLARQALITSYGSHQFYWALPVLYMHPDFDGYLMADRPSVTHHLYSTQSDRDALELFSEEAVIVAAMDAPSEIGSSILVEDDLADLMDLEPAPHAAAGSRSEDETIVSNLIQQLSLQPLMPPTPSLSPTSRGVVGTTSAAHLSATPSARRSPSQPTVTGSAESKSTGGTSSGVSSTNSSPDVYSALVAHLSERLHPQAVLASQPVRPMTSLAIQRLQLNEQLLQAAEPIITTLRKTTGFPRPHRSRAEKVMQFQPGLSGEAAIDLHQSTATHTPRQWGLALLSTSAIAVALLLLWMPDFRFWTSVEERLSPVEYVEASSAEAGLNAETATEEQNSQSVAVSLRDQAIAALSQNDLRLAQEKINLLIDQDNLPAAAAVLSSASAEQQQQPELRFLTGKIAWIGSNQQITDTEPAKLTNIRSQWASAVELDSTNPLYHNALGFALYAEGNWQAAIASWCTAIALLEAQNPNAVPEVLNLGDITVECLLPTNPSTNPELVTAYAGVSLVLAKVAGNAVGETQAELYDQARWIQEYVLYPDRAAALEANRWLWLEPTQQEWQSLAQQ
jgi:hypothetical protein